MRWEEGEEEEEAKQWKLDREEWSSEEAHDRRSSNGFLTFATKKTSGEAVLGSWTLAARICNRRAWGWVWANLNLARAKQWQGDDANDTSEIRLLGSTMSGAVAATECREGPTKPLWRHSQRSIGGVQD